MLGCQQRVTFRYHSHPIFAPKPSQKDSENQRNYQALFRCEQTRLEPFVGAIVGPYDLQLPTQVHCCRYFCSPLCGCLAMPRVRLLKEGNSTCLTALAYVNSGWHPPLVN